MDGLAAALTGGRGYFGNIVVGQGRRDVLNVALSTDGALPQGVAWAGAGGRDGGNGELMLALGGDAFLDGAAPLTDFQHLAGGFAGGIPDNNTLERMAQGKGPGYERWAKIYNLKQMAAALQFLQEYGLTDYDELAAKIDAAVDQEHALAGELRAVQEELTHTTALMGAVVQYAKTRPMFDGYKAAKYSKKYLAQHEAELADYREAKATMNDLLDGTKLPKMEALKQKRRELTERKKALTAQYRAAQKEMRELVTAKGNIDHLINLTGGRADKEQTR